MKTILTADKLPTKNVVAVTIDSHCRTERFTLCGQQGITVPKDLSDTQWHALLTLAEAFDRDCFLDREWKGDDGEKYFKLPQKTPENPRIGEITQVLGILRGACELHGFNLDYSYYGSGWLIGISRKVIEAETQGNAVFNGGTLTTSSGDMRLLVVPGCYEFCMN